VRLDLAGQASPGAASAGNDALVALSAAALAQHRVLLHYQGADGGRSEREVDPYGLAFRNGNWYLVGMCRLRGGDALVPARPHRRGRAASGVVRPAGRIRRAGIPCASRWRRCRAPTASRCC
jgi:hypothetical protein